MMKYRVFDKETKEDITDKNDWVITPDGTLYINVWGDHIRGLHAIYVLEEDVKEFLNN